MKKLKKYIEECKLYFEKFENGNNNDDIEGYYDEENENQEEIESINNNKDNDNDENNNVEFDKEKKD